MTVTPDVVRERSGGDAGRTTHAGTTRRAFVRDVGAVGAALLVGGTGALALRAADEDVLASGSGAAYAPWDAWDARTGAFALVDAAVLAPSPHNTQPWRFVAAPGRLDVLADRARRTPAVDPYDREHRIALGAAVENAALAAAANGLRLRALPVAPPGVAVRLAVRPGPRRAGPLYRAIPRRHSDRSGYDDRPVPGEALASMAALDAGLAGVRVLWVTERGRRTHLGELLVDAARAVVADGEQSREGFRWFRSSAGDIARHRDGLTLDAQGLPRATTALAKLLPAQDRAAGDRFWVERTRRVHVPTAAAFGVVLVRDRDDDGQLVRAGRLLQRVHLWTVAHGLGLQHMNQVTERADRERHLGQERRFGPALDALVAAAGWQPVATFRTGYPAGDDGRRRSPRRAADEVLA